MNVRRFTARSSRDALNLVKQAFGQEAVVLSTRPCSEGVEVLAMAPDSVPAYEGPSHGSTASGPAHLPARLPAQAKASRPAVKSLASAGSKLQDSSPEQDAERLAMSTLSFQDYVRERMLRRRRAEIQGQNAGAGAGPAGLLSAPHPSAQSAHSAHSALSAHSAHSGEPPRLPAPTQPHAALGEVSAATAAAAATQRFGAAVRSLDEWGVPAASPSRQPPQGATPERNRAEWPESGERPAAAASALHNLADDIDDAFRPFVDSSQRHGPAAAAGQEAHNRPTANASHHAQVVQELRDMRGLIEQRFGALAYLEKLKREPRSAQLLQRLLEAGFSPVLARRLADALPADADEAAWPAAVLERNLLTGERESALEDTGGVFALVGPTGVGKTTSTAKLAAAFATRHGAANLGLITLDAYRVAAHEQLRAYGKILGVPVHTAHDRASLDDLLDLLAGKKMVLIDTAGMPPRDSRTAELLQMLTHRSVHRLLVLNATAQGETLDDVIAAYQAVQCRGIVLSKIDEAIKLAPSLDALIRHKLKVVAVANGQRVPEDWHRLSSVTLVQRALRDTHAAAWKLRPDDVSLILMEPRRRPGDGQ